MKNKVLVIVGPTCTGKTTLALKLADKLIGIVISADSRQLLKSMDFGTGKKKFKPEDVSNIIGYDLINPDETFSAFDFANFARTQILEIVKDDKLPILVGGTGFYIDVVTGKVKLDSISKDLELRKMLANLNTETLVDKLFELDTDKVFTAKIDLKNKVRIIRAIEKLSLIPQENKLEGADVNSYIEKWRDELEFIFVGLTSSRDTLYANADTWLDDVWDLIVEETQGLLNAGFGESPFLKGFIYKSAVDHLKGSLSYEEALVRAKFDTHAYIRRQQTWFKKNKEIVWFEIADPDLENKIIKLTQTP